MRSREIQPGVSSGVPVLLFHLEGYDAAMRCGAVVVGKFCAGFHGAIDGGQDPEGAGLILPGGETFPRAALCAFAQLAGLRQRSVVVGSSQGGAVQ